MHAHICKKFITNVPHVHNIASQTMRKVCFETYQSLWLTNIVLAYMSLESNDMLLLFTFACKWVTAEIRRNFNFYRAWLQRLWIIFGACFLSKTQTEAIMMMMLTTLAASLMIYIVSTICLPYSPSFSLLNVAAWRALHNFKVKWRRRELQPSASKSPPLPSTDIY